jgi:uncharacterized protein YneF (UPF0154 family)
MIVVVGILGAVLGVFAGAYFTCCMFEKKIKKLQDEMQGAK